MKEHLPVLIYFNGGGLMAGSGSEPRYAGDAGLLAPAVFEHAGTAAHGCNLPLVALRIISTPAWSIDTAVGADA